MVDEAASLFGHAFASAMADGGSESSAFDCAKAAVLCTTERGRLDNGMETFIQKFDLVDPEDYSRVHRCTALCPPLCSLRGRLIGSAGSRGFIAAGVPRLLI